MLCVLLVAPLTKSEIVADLALKPEVTDSDGLVALITDKPLFEPFLLFFLLDLGFQRFGDFVFIFLLLPLPLLLNQLLIFRDLFNV